MGRLSLRARARHGTPLRKPIIAVQCVDLKREADKMKFPFASLGREAAWSSPVPSAPASHGLENLAFGSEHMTKLFHHSKNLLVHTVIKPLTRAARAIAAKETGHEQTRR